MRHLVPLAIAALMLAPPALAAGITVDMPNLSFPEGDTTLSTQGCTDRKDEACPIRN